MSETFTRGQSPQAKLTSSLIMAGQLIEQEAIELAELVLWLVTTAKRERP